MRFVSTKNLDFFGFSTSLLCAIHCVALPFILTMGIFSGAEWLENPVLEWSLIVISICIATWSLGTSYVKTHKNINPLMIAILGVAFLISSRMVEGEAEHYLTGIGGFLIAWAHYRNWKLSSQSALKLSAQ